MGRAFDLARLLNSSGLVPDAKLLALAASKLTGQVPDANAPSGSVIQVVNSFSTTSYVTNSSTPQATNLSASITPVSASSKILVLMTVAFRNDGGARKAIGLHVYRNATLLSPNSASPASFASANDVEGTMPVIQLDSPNTTSPVTYTLYYNNLSGDTIRINWDSNGTCAPRSTITLVEVAG